MPVGPLAHALRLDHIDVEVHDEQEPEGAVGLEQLRAPADGKGADCRHVLKYISLATAWHGADKRGGGGGGGGQQRHAQHMSWGRESPSDGPGRMRWAGGRQQRTNGAQRRRSLARHRSPVKVCARQSMCVTKPMAARDAHEVHGIVASCCQPARPRRTTPDQPLKSQQQQQQQQQVVDARHARREGRLVKRQR